MCPSLHVPLCPLVQNRSSPAFPASLIVITVRTPPDNWKNATRAYLCRRQRTVSQQATLQLMSCLMLARLKPGSANQSGKVRARMKLLLGQIDTDRPQLDESSLPGIRRQQPKSSNSVLLMYSDRPNTTDWKDMYDVRHRQL